MPRRSAAFQRIVLVLSAVAVFGAAAWVGMRLFEPVPVPPIPPPRSRVSFSPKADIRNNPLFEALRSVVTGEIEPGALGRLNPFVGPQGGGQVGLAGGSRLASMEEIPLSGGRVVALSRGNDGAMLVLLAGALPDGNTSYEIRSYGPVAASTFTSWTKNGDVALDPVAMAQDANGTVWLGAKSGHVGSASAGVVPTWIADSAQDRPVMEMLALPDGRVWVSDGLNVRVVQDGRISLTFNPWGFVSEDSSWLTERETALSALPPDLQPALGAPLPDGTMARGFDVRRMFLQQGGGVGITTGYSTFLYSPIKGETERYLDALASSSLPFALSPMGDVWSWRHTDGALVRSWATGTEAYTDPYVLPKRAPRNPDLAANDLTALYALDYSSTSTILWRSQGDGWLAQVVAASGTVPADDPVRVDVDGSGDVWAMMKQGGLLRIRRQGGQVNK